MNTTVKKSNIKLEDIFPYLKSISGFFGVPFDDLGFLWNPTEITVHRNAFEKYFKEVSSVILGVPIEDIDSMIKLNKERSKHWCWKHNVSYNIYMNSCINEIFYIHLSDSQMHWPIELKINDWKLFSKLRIYIHQNRELYIESNLQIESIDDILHLKNQEKLNKLYEDLSKLEIQKEKHEKKLNECQSKIKSINEEINQLKSLK